MGNIGGVAEYWDDFGAPRGHGETETRGLWFLLSDKIIAQLCNAGVGKLGYDINLNSLGVNPPLTPPRRGSQSDRVRRE
ncbi:MAG: hypothetical protein F6K24_31335 [Okeania sp. SIO2D1]|nr:hypothetical protein [Okeania sp. SIO2D1]